MERIFKILLLGVVALSLISCGSDPVKEDPAPVDVSTPSDTGETTGGSVTSHPLDDPNSPLSRRVIYFEFNKANISDEDREFISAHANYLSNNSSESVVLEGHADERGTREYNISLGERRAKAVMQLLVVQGASKSQIQVISFGEERPVALDHDEGSWQQNRRVELIYSGH